TLFRSAAVTRHPITERTRGKAWNQELGCAQRLGTAARACRAERRRRPSGPTSAWSNYRTNPRRAAVPTAWICRSEIVGAWALVPRRRGERRVGAPRLRGQGARRRTGWRRALPTGVGRRRSDQLGLELDRGAGERLRHRAVRLGRVGLLLERRLVDPRHFRLGL